MVFRPFAAMASVAFFLPFASNETGMSTPDSNAKPTRDLSFSVVDHLLWDLRAIFEMAVAEKLIASSPATRLYTPKHAAKGKTRANDGGRGEHRAECGRITE